MTDPRYAIVAILDKLNQDSKDTPKDRRKIPPEDRARLIDLIKKLLRMAFDPGVTDAEREAFMVKAAQYAAEHGVRFDEISPDAPAGASSKDERAATLMPEPGNPLAVARALLPEWQDQDGNLTLRRWNGAWMRYDGTRWRQAEDESLYGWFFRRLEHCWYVDPRDWTLAPWSPSPSKIGNLLKTLGSAIVHLGRDTAPPVWLDDQDHPDPRRMVALMNGLLDTGEGKLLPSTAAFFNEVAVPFAYDPGAPEPARWNRFLREVWPDDPDAAALLAEWVGYVISGRTDIQKIGGLFGPPRSGKGVIARVLGALAGTGNVAGPTTASLRTNFGLAPLIGRTLAVVSDSRLSGGDARVLVERLLAISGEDLITIPRKYREDWHGRLSARFMMISNEIPAFDDPSGAIATRFVILTTRNSFLGREDPDLTDKLLRELPGILNWALDGLRRLDANHGRFTQPASSAAALADMNALASPVRAFLEDECVPEGSIERGELFTTWQGWCRSTHNTPGTIQRFSTELHAAWPHVADARPNEGGKRVRKWVGVSLRSTASSGPVTVPEGGAESGEPTAGNDAGSSGPSGPGITVDRSPPVSLSPDEARNLRLGWEPYGAATGAVLTALDGAPRRTIDEGELRRIVQVHAPGGYEAGADFTADVISELAFNGVIRRTPSKRWTRKRRG